MARNSRRMPVSRDDLWAALSDGRTYATWVVGTSTIRDVDDNWPQLGSRLHYRIGRGPLRHDGHTEVTSVDPGRCLELEAHAWPLGSVRIELTLRDDGDGTVVEMVEHPARGTAAMLHNPVGDVLLRLRNVETLRRLERLAQR
ncbi:MAG TPA: SRPBCC domain-containing protein [Mycobacteriales bacterium]|nr:SRPBCC domain-containing protein [Mycobacteriales bacterium]